MSSTERVTENAPTTDRVGRERLLALVVVCLGTLMVIVDQNIVNVALPAIKPDLGISESALAWVVNAYVTPFGGLLLLAGRMGDLVGRRRLFISGMVVFTASSLLCGLATNAGSLIAGRLVQGVGGAMCAAVMLGMLVTLFPEPRLQAMAMGVFSFVQAAGGSLGSVLGGILVQAASWEWIFFINIPLGILTVSMALRFLTRDPGADLSDGSDALGGILVTAGLMTAVYTIVTTADHGVQSKQTAMLGAVAILLLAAFIVREATAPNPLLPLRMFRSRVVNAANLTLVLLIAGMFGFLFFSTQYLQQSMGLDALWTGLGMVPVAMAIGFVSLALAARLMTALGPRRVLLVGLVLITVGMALLGRAPVGGHYAIDVLPAQLLMGVGFGAAMPALMTLGMSAATAEDAGVTSGMFNTSMQVGGALGLAVLAALAADRTAGLRAAGAPEIEALTGGYHLGFLIAAGFAATAFIACFVVLPNPRRSQESVPAGTFRPGASSNRGASHRD